MRAIRQHEFGGPAQLRDETVADPEPGEGQVRIRVEAAGVHLLDTMIRRGESGGPFPLPELPMTPGREVAGVVDRLGAGVEDRWLGARVVAHLGMASGGYAELALAATGSLHEVPAELEATAAVALIGTGRTAMGILELGDPGPTDVVFVQAAAGGLGTILVQAAKHAGATVLGAAGGASKVELARELGADLAVDYTGDGWVEQVRAFLGERRVTLLLDGVGGDVGRAGLELLGSDGRLVLFGWSAGEPTPLSAADIIRLGITVSGAVGPRMIGRPGGLRPLEERALGQAAAGVFRPVVTTFGLVDAPAAHEALESRTTIGKVVLVP